MIRTVFALDCVDVRSAAAGRARAPTGRGRISRGGGTLLRRPLVVPLVGDLDADQRTLRSGLVDRMRPDGLPVIDLRRVTLDAENDAAAARPAGPTVGSIVRMVLSGEPRGSRRGF